MMYEKKHTNLEPKIYRLPKNLIKEMKTYCELQEIKSSQFIRDAVQEKLSRKSIEDNLIVKANSLEVEQLLANFQLSMNKQIDTLRGELANMQSTLSNNILSQNRLIHQIIVKINNI